MATKRDPSLEDQAARGLRTWAVREADLLHLLSVRIGAVYTSVKDAAARLGIPVAPASLAAPAPTHRHIKRGSTYTELRRGRLQTDVPLGDMAQLVAYQAEDGEWWFRAPQEFDDPARFEKLPFSSALTACAEPAQYPLRDDLCRIDGWNESTYAGRVQLLHAAYEDLLHRADRAKLEGAAREPAGGPSYDDLVRALELIRHATAPSPNDGGHHENAHEISDEILRRVALARGARGTSS